MMGRRRGGMPPMPYGYGLLMPLLMIVFGFLVIIFPQIISWIIGLYLIVNGFILLLRFV